MRILFATQYYPPFAPGGAEWSSLRWAQELSREGHTVVVATLNYGAAPFEKAEGVQVYRLPFPCKLQPGQGSAPRRWVRNPFIVLSFAWGVAALARKTAAAVIHCQNSGVLLSSYLAARLVSLPLVFTLRDTDLICPIGALCLLDADAVPADCSLLKLRTECLALRSRLYGEAGVNSRGLASLRMTMAWLCHLLECQCLRRADRLVAISQAILALHPERVLPAAARARARVIYNPAAVVSPSMGHKDWRLEPGLQGRKIVLCAGKLSPGKGTATLLEAARLLRDRQPDAVFVLAGKGVLPPEGTRLPNVRHLGSLPHGELMDLFAVADVVVVPSLWPEPLGRANLDAMAHGKPVVATRIGGIPEIIEDGVNGLLVPRKDGAALADAIACLLRDPLLARRMGEAGLARVRTNLDSRRLCAQMLAAYGEAVTSRPRAWKWLCR